MWSVVQGIYTWVDFYVGTYLYTPNIIESRIRAHNSTDKRGNKVDGMIRMCVVVEYVLCRRADMLYSHVKEFLLQSLRVLFRMVSGGHMSYSMGRKYFWDEWTPWLENWFLHVGLNHPLIHVKCMYWICTSYSSVID